MAITVAVLATGQVENAGPSFTTSSVAWAAGDVIVVAVTTARSPNAGNLVSAAAPGLAFTKLGQVGPGNESGYTQGFAAAIFYAVASAAGSGAVTVSGDDWGFPTAGSVLRLQDVDTAAPVFGQFYVDIEHGARAPGMVVATRPGDCVVEAISYYGGGGSIVMSPTGGQTDATNTNGAINGQNRSATAYLIADAATETLSRSRQAGNDFWVQCAAVFQPASTTTTQPVTPTGTVLAGGTASSPNATDVGFEAARAFDGDPATYARITGLTPGGARAILQKVWTDGQLRTLSTFAITSSQDAATRDPLSWRLEALSGGAWSTVATFTGQTFAARGERRVFTPAGTVPPSSGFRLVILERQDTPSTGNYSTVSVGEIEFHGAIQPGVPQQYAAALPMADASVRISNLGGAATPDASFPLANVKDGNAATDSRLVTAGGAPCRWIFEWPDGQPRRFAGLEIVNSATGPAAEDPYSYSVTVAATNPAETRTVLSDVQAAFSGRGQTHGAVLGEPLDVAQVLVQVHRRAGAAGTDEAIENTTGVGFRAAEIRLFGIAPGAIPTIGLDTGPTIVDDPAGQKVSIAGPVNVQGDAAGAVSVTLATEPAGQLLGPFPATLDTARIRWLFERVVEDIGPGVWRATATVSASGSTATAQAAQTFAIDAIEGEPALTEPVVTPTAFKATSVLRADHPARAGMVAMFLAGVESSAGKIRNLVDGTELPVSLEGGAVRSVDAVSPFVLLPTEAARAIVTGAIARNPSGFSILAWVEPSAAPESAAVRPAFFWQKTASGGNVASLRRTLAADRLTADVGTSATDFGTASLSDIPVGQPYPVALDWDGTTYRHFRRGKPVLSGAAAPAPDNVVGAVFGIAGSGDPAAVSWPGKYRWIAVWDRSQAANLQAIVDGASGALLVDPAPAGAAPQFVTPANLPAATAGAPYSAQLSGTGSGALVFSLGTGAPAGWAVSAAGMLTHAGPAVGAYSIPVVLTGDTAPAATRTFSATISAPSAPGTAPAFTTPTALQAGTAGAAYAAQLSGTGSGTLVYSLGAGAPAGWSVSASGLLSHAGPAAATYSIPVVLAGDTLPVASRSFTVTIAAASTAPPAAGGAIAAPGTTRYVEFVGLTIDGAPAASVSGLRYLITDSADLRNTSAILARGGPVTTTPQATLRVYLPDSAAGVVHGTLSTSDGNLLALNGVRTLARPMQVLG